MPTKPQSSLTAAGPWLRPVVAAAFLSAFLFCWSLVQAAALISPQVAGASGVWPVVLVYGFAAAGAGVAWAWASARFLPSAAQPWIQSAVVMSGLIWLPPWRFPSFEKAAEPAFPILSALAWPAGFQAVLLVSSVLLLDRWFARNSGGSKLRKAAAWGVLSGFLAVPLLIEPVLGRQAQAMWWSVAYAGCALLMAASALVNRGRIPPRVEASAEALPKLSYFLGAGWAGCGAAAVTALSNRLCLLVFPDTLVWAIPAFIYALTAVLAVAKWKWLTSRYIVWAVPLAAAGPAMHLFAVPESGAYAFLLLYSAALFILGAFCHSQLGQYLNEANLLGLPGLSVAAGVMVGSFLAGVAAPFWATWEIELPTLAVAIAAFALQGSSAGPWGKRLILVPLIALVALMFTGNLRIPYRGVVALARTTRGPVAVLDIDGSTRGLRVGADMRSTQLQVTKGGRVPTTFYGKEAGLGQFLQARVGAARIAVFGLGAGTLAVYGRPGDVFTFFESDPGLPNMASAFFDYLKMTEARVDVARGDPRLLLAKEPPQSYHVLIIDAFAGGSIPWHLITREAFELYYSRLRPEGVIAVNTVSRVIDIKALLAGIAKTTGRSIMLTQGRAGVTAGASDSEWVFITAAPELIRDMPRHLVRPLPAASTVWTDERHSVLGLLK